MVNFLGWVGLPSGMLCACFFAWKVGAAAERRGSLAIFVANVTANIVLALTYPQFPSAALGILDLILACGLLAIAVQYANYWLGVAMLLQSGSLCLQALDIAGEGPSMLVHIIANNMISGGMLGCIIGGIVGSWRSKGIRRLARTTLESTDPAAPSAIITF